MDKNNNHTEVMTPGDMERLEQDQIIKKRLSYIKRKILVMSGKGGVGKSTVAAYLALLLSNNGHRVGLLDVDLHGPSIPQLLNIKGGLEILGEGVVGPYQFSDRLQVVSLEMVLGDKGELALLMEKSDLEINRAYGQIIDRIEKGSKKDQ